MNTEKRLCMPHMNSWVKQRKRLEMKQLIVAEQAENVVSFYEYKTFIQKTLVDKSTVKYSFMHGFVSKCEPYNMCLIFL